MSIMTVPQGQTPPSYEYSPIQGHRGIRLLTIFASDDDGATLRAGMSDHSLDHSPDYIALSYVWGKAEATIPMYIDGRMIKIRKNLDTALKGWRRRQGTFRIWVDAICINQEDNDEKSSQVQLMRFIYGSAQMVLASLEVADGWEAANNIMQHLCQAKRDDTLPKFTGENCTSANFRSRVDEHLEAQQLPERSNDDWQSVARMMENPWFQRAWTLQECYVTKDCKLFHGDTLFDFGNFCATVLDETFGVLVPRFWRHMLEHTGPASRINLIRFQHSRDNQNDRLNALPLFSLLTFTSETQTTKTCDRIYGLLGITLEADRPSLQPRYGPNEEDIFLRVAEYAIEEGKGPMLLHTAPNLEKNLPAGWASWIPRWNGDGTGSTFGTASHRTNTCIFSASGGSSPRFRSEEKQGLRILSVRGRVLDSIEKFGSCQCDFTEEAEFTERADLITEALIEVHDMIQSRDGYRRLYPESRASILSRLATCDLEANGWHARAPITNSHAMALVFAFFIKEHDSDPRSEAYVENFRDIMAGWVRPPESPGDLELFVSAASYHFRRLQRFVTSRGYIGQICRSLGRQGDQVVLIEGCHVPFVLRPQAGGRYSVVGDCYLHGVMNGEAWDGNLAEKMEII